MGLPVLSDTLNNYLVDINRYPVLSRDEEFRVAERYHRLRQLDDAHILVTSNLRYVVKIALEFRNYGCRIADLIQEGNIGLMVAVKKFDPFKGFRLITYATWWIRSFIQEFILKTKGIVNRSSKALKKRLFYKKEAPLAPLAAGSGTDDADIEPITDLSLNHPLGEDISFQDMLSDPAPGQEELVSGQKDLAFKKTEVNKALGLLNEKERIVIEKRLMAEEPESLQGLGDRLGLTRERVRQIESGAMKKLQKALSKSALIREGC